MTGGRSCRAVRAAVFAAACVLLAATGHALMSSAPLPWWALPGAGGATFAGAWLVAGRERGVLAVTSASVVAQAALKLARKRRRGGGFVVAHGGFPHTDAQKDIQSLLRERAKIAVMSNERDVDPGRCSSRPGGSFQWTFQFPKSRKRQLEAPAAQAHETARETLEAIATAAARATPSHNKGLRCALEGKPWVYTESIRVLRVGNRTRRNSMKCEHAPCTCMAVEGSRFCSNHCQLHTASPDIETSGIADEGEALFLRAHRHHVPHGPEVTEAEPVENRRVVLVVHLEGGAASRPPRCISGLLLAKGSSRDIHTGARTTVKALRSPWQKSKRALSVNNAGHPARATLASARAAARGTRWWRPSRSDGPAGDRWLRG